VLHWSFAQVIVVPAQTPPEQTSPYVHAFPSLHEFELFVWTQPVAGLHESFVQGLLSLQSSVPVPVWQTPFKQVSPVVQAFPSLHEAVLFVCWQPADGSQLSFVQGLLSLQSNAVTPGWQTAPLQLSPTVQALPSSHGTAVVTACPTHDPLLQVSLVVQTLPSSHASVLFVYSQPVAGTHVSVVHGL